MKSAAWHPVTRWCHNRPSLNVCEGEKKDEGRLKGEILHSF